MRKKIMNVEEVTVEDEGVKEPEVVENEKQPQNEAPVLTQEDRSVFNCPDCKGEGLKNPHSLCDRCLGTGKV